MKLPRILIVDDMEDIRASYRSILTPKNTSEDYESMAESLFDDEAELLLDSEDDLNDDAVTTQTLMDDIDLPKYDLVETSQGMDAVKACKEALNQNNPFWLIFLDMRMPPGIDGLEAAKRIRMLDPYVEIVIMTAYSDYSFEEIQKGVGNPQRLLYFQKPFQSEQILQLALSLSQKWQLEKNVRDQQQQSSL